MSASDRAQDPERESPPERMLEFLPAWDRTLHRGVLALERLADAAEVLVGVMQARHHTERLARDDQRVAREDEQREAFRGGGR